MATNDKTAVDKVWTDYIGRAAPLKVISGNTSKTAR